MKNTFVNGKTLIGDIVNRYPDAVGILLSVGMHCLGCPASQAETLEDACAVHGLEAQPVIDALNAKIGEEKQ
jgi:hybrid cluster-associated redox disulfide protein